MHRWRLRQERVRVHLLHMLLGGLLFLLLFGGTHGVLEAAEPDPEARGPVPDRLARVLLPEQLADFHFLEHLGWRFMEDGTVERITIHAGRPCERKDLAAAHAAGDLRVLFPPGMTAKDLATFGGGLAQLSLGMASRCAYQLRVADAVARATEKLAARAESGDYTFPKFIVIDSPWFRLSPPEPEWIELEDGWRARDSSARAIEAFYVKEAVAECYAGQLVALFATQYELYGPDAFNRAYAPAEIVIGRPPDVEKAPFGWNADRPDFNRCRALLIEGADRGRDPGLVLAGLGRQAFVGQAGVLQDQANRMYANENFVIVRVSLRAVAALKANGGFAYVGRQTKEALGHLEAERSPFATAAVVSASERAIEEILSKPVFSDLVIYVHPYGVVPLREIAEKKLRNMGAAVEVVLYCCGREYSFFQRYYESFVKRWLEAHDPGGPAPASPPVSRPAPPAAPPAPPPTPPGS